ncbi:NAD(P)-binding protein [Pseudohyphozyma bogoriensis]|nr:NAD(P)-binding protein [Pseudohyphozyma bogoriensis]
MSSKSIVLITGGNTGLGFEIVKALFKSTAASYEIYMGSRSLSKAEDAIKELEAEVPDSSSTVQGVQVDIASDESIEKCFKEMEDKVGKVDVLINNAGISIDNEIASGKKTMRQAWTEMYDVNVTGTQVMTNTFVPLLLKSTSPRLVFITSGTSSIEEASKGLPFTATKPPAGWPKPNAWSFSGYRSCKAGMNMMFVEWGRILKEDKVKMWAISPGFLATGLAGAGKEKLLAMGAKEPYIGGEFVRDVVEGKRDEDVGKAIRIDDVQPW